MAQSTFRGTTNEVLLEIATSSGKINQNTKITITDNNYTSANLLTIIANTTNGGTLTQKIVLEKPAAQSAMVDTAAHLITIVGGVNKYTGALTANDTSITATQLNTIAGGTTGKVTATLVNTVTIDSATVIALENVEATDNITFAPTDNTLSDNSDVRALISLSKLLPKADFSAINSIISSDVSLVKQALVILKNNAAVAVNLSAIELTAKDANDIAKATKGGLTATIKDGKVAETLKALSDVNASDNISFTTTDRTVKASDLFNLGAKFKTITNFDASSVTTVTGEAKDVATLTAALTTATAAGATIADTTVAGQITLTELAAIKTAGSGNLTATVAADAASILNTKLSAASTAAADILTLTVNGTTAAAADLAGLVTLTGGKIKLEATTVSGLLADVQSVYITNKAQFTALGNENVTIITNTPSATQLNAIAAATTGKVTATLDPSALLTQATVTALKDVKTSDNITFAPTSGTLTGKDSMNALLAIKKILPNANFSAVADITGVDAKDATLVKNVLKLINPASDVSFAIGELSAKDANDIAKVITTGKLTATIKDGGIAATLKALSDIDGTLDDLTFKTTDTTAKASDIVALDALILTPANLDLSKVKTITGTSAETDAATGAIPNALTVLGAGTAVEVKITGTVDGADIKAIIDATTGKVTATLEAADANTLAGYLVDASVGQTVSNAINVVVNDTSVGDAKDLADIAAATSGKIKVESLEVKGSLADVSNVYITNKGKFTGLGNEDVKVTGGAAAAVSVDDLAKATSGILTATVTDAAANVLVSQLKNANAKDDLTIVVLDNAAGTSAKDLLTLDGKTSLLVTAAAVTKISGSVADVNKLLGADVTVGTAVNYAISGTVKAADLNAIADTTTGVITATVAADTAQNLAYLLDSVNLNTTDKLTLKVTGATAAAFDLLALDTKTTVDVQVDAKEVTGTIAQLGAAGTGLYVLAAGFAGLGNKNVKVTDVLTASTAADVTAVNAILAGTTGVVTATANGTVANLLTIANATSGKDALTLNIITDTSATAANLLALDAKTSVKVDATALSVSGTAAQLKELAAAKGVQLAKDVALTVTGATNAADLAAVLKATTGKVTANVAADTASALNKALKDANSSDALTLTVNDTIVAAKDLISLNGKTSVPIVVNVGAITGNIAEITDVFVTNVAQFTGVTTDDATISGTVGAGDYAALNTVLAAANTTGVVTATIQANDAATLNSTFTNATAADKLTFKVNGTTAVATDLTGLDAKTDVAVDASAIKNIDGTTATGAAEVKAAYVANAAGKISGLGNELVDLTGSTDADTALVKAINDFTTGVVTLDVLTFDKAAAAGAIFNLNQLGDLNGITGLVEIDADNGQADTIAIKLDDLLAANDSKTSFSFDITGDNGGTDSVTFDATGWTVTTTTPNIKYEFTKGSQTITVDLTDISSATVL